MRAKRLRGFRASLRALTLGVVFAAALPNCGPPIPPGRPLSSAEMNGGVALLPGDTIERIVEAGRPTLHMIRREGDPKGALAVAVFPPGGSEASIRLARLMEHRLAKVDKNNPLHLSVHSIGFIIAVEVDSPDAASAWVKHVHRALNEEVSAEESRKLHLKSYLKAASSRVVAPSPYRSCMGQLGAEGKPALTTALSRLDPQNTWQDLEELRITSTGAGRVGLAALGKAPLLQQVAKAHDRKWSKGATPDDSWSPERQVSVIESAGGRELRIALRVSDAEAALAGIRALRKKNHPLHARLHALDSQVTAEDMEVALRPAGACAGLTIRIATESPQPSVLSLAQAAIVAQDEMLATLGQSLTEDEVNLALVSPSGALEAAALGAWAAVRSNRTGTKTASIIEYRSPPEESLSAEELGATINEARASWTKRTLPVVAAAEVGQREVWMLLASECGTVPEIPEETGLRALTMSSLAAQFSGTRGVTLAPWISSQGMGLVAHAPPLRGESPNQHSARVARSLATAFAGAPLDGRVVAAKRSEQLSLLGSNPAEALMTNIIGGGHPSMVEPWGNDKAIATQSTADVERTRDDLVREPLRLALLQTSSAGQKESAGRALAAWLAPLRAHPSTCGSASPEPAAPGLWQLETIDEHIQAGAYVGVFSPTARHLGKATEYLLNRPNGYLKNALLVPGLAASAEASWIGGPKFGGLVIRVGAEDHELDRAVQQVRALLDRLSAGAMNDQDAARASREFARREDRVSRSRAGRLTRLWLSGGTASGESSLSKAQLRALHKTLAADQHRVVTIRLRK